MDTTLGRNGVLNTVDNAAIRYGLWISMFKMARNIIKGYPVIIQNWKTENKVKLEIRVIEHKLTIDGLRAD